MATFTKGQARKIRRTAIRLAATGQEVAWVPCGGYLCPSGLGLRSEKGIRVDFVDEGPYPREGYETADPTVRYEYSNEHFYYSLEDIFRLVPGAPLFVEASVGPYAESRR